MSSTAFKVVNKSELKEEFDNPATPVDLYLKLLNNQRDCDVFFVVGPERERIGAHKAILKARSPYFEARLSGRWEDGSTNDGEAINEIVLQEDEPSIFRVFLEHIYAYLFKSNSVVEAVKLLHLAQFYSVPALAILCEEVLEQTFQTDDLLETFVLARRFCLKKVVKKAVETMSDYFIQLAKSPTFKHADEATLVYLLERNDLNVEEVTLFSILLEWADYQIGNSTEHMKPGRNDILNNLIPLIRFPTMSAREFAEIVAPTNILPLETKYDLLIYFNVSWEKKMAVVSFPFSTTRRMNVIKDIELYEDKPRPGRGTYSKTSLKKRSDVQDVLTINVSDSCRTQCHVRVVSVVLEAPRYGESYFQNSSEVAAMKLPISVAISVSEFNGQDNQPTWISEEVVANLGNGQMILKLDKTRVIVLDKSKSYQITARFLSDVYTVPPWVGYGSRSHKSRRDENFDYFTANKLRERFSLGILGFCRIDRLSISGGNGASRDPSAVQATSVNEMSSGLHLIRSIQFVTI